MYSLLKEIRQQGVDVTLYDAGNLRSPSRIFATVRDIRRISKNFDVTHAQFGSVCALVASIARGPKVVTLRGSDYYGCPTGSWKSRIHGNLMRILTRLAMPCYQHITVASQRMRVDVQHPWHRSDIAVIPSGIDLQRFAPIDKQKARKLLGLEGDYSPWVLFSSVRAANPVKRCELATSAVENLKRKLPDVKLKVLTDVPHELVPIWVNACDVCLLTSTHEGWPNIIKESLACNVPFVSTDVSDLKGIADVEISCIVTEANPERLSEGLHTAIQHRGNLSLRKHAESMDIRDMAKLIIDVYHKICELPTSTAKAGDECSSSKSLALSSIGGIQRSGKSKQPNSFGTCS